MSKCWRIESISSMVAISVECDFRKSYWLLYSMPLTDKYSNNWSYTIISNTLEIDGSNDIGL